MQEILDVILIVDRERIAIIVALLELPRSAVEPQA